MPSFLDKPLHRRKVLRGAGVSLTLPLLEAMLTQRGNAAAVGLPQSRPSGSAAPPPRMISCYIPNGVNIQEWTPQGRGKNWTLSPTLQKLADFQAEMTVLTGLGHPNSEGGHSGGDTWLTGAHLKGKAGKDYQNAVSADQLIAEVHGEYTRFPSIELSDVGGPGDALHSHTLSFDRSGTPIPTENSPQRLFDRMFVPDDGASRAATLQRYAERRSILDQILGEASQLQKRLSKTDQQKLEEYLNFCSRCCKRWVSKATNSQIPPAAGMHWLSARQDQDWLLGCSSEFFDSATAGQ